MYKEVENPRIGEVRRKRGRCHPLVSDVSSTVILPSSLQFQEYSILVIVKHLNVPLLQFLSTSLS